MRRATLIEAAITAVGTAGSLDVTVAQIARRAGMSPALAHYYFGSKDQIFLAAMRHILGKYARAVRRHVARAESPRARLDAIVIASFRGDNFDHATIAAWLNFYVLAQTHPEARRLLLVYHRRLRSNLLVPLRPLTGRAEPVAATLSALIDGLYLRAALASDNAVETAGQGEAAIAMCVHYLDEVLK